MSLLTYFKKVSCKESCKEEGSESSEEIAPAKKRKRCLIESDDSEEDGDDPPSTPNDPSAASKVRRVDHPTSDMASRVQKVIDSGLEGGNTPPKRKRSITTKGVSKETKGLSKEGSYVHDQLNWLQKDHLKDKQGHPIAHPDYDPRTLQVPYEYYKTLTPGFQQWWTIKSDNYDSVVMFKVGKFYELYHMDAVIGVRELGLVFMKADFAHCGFPEKAFGRYSQTLVQKGFRVVRVEQMETPAMMEQRIKKSGVVSKSDRVVRREVCSVITKGTRTLNTLNGDITEGESVFLLAIKEVPISEATFTREFGVCFVDTCVGTIHIGQFQDDSECSRLRTLFAHYPPGHVLYERKGLHPHTQLLIGQLLPGCIKDALVPDTEFWGCAKTLKALAEGGYFKPDGENQGTVRWPPALEAVLDDGVGFTVSPKFELAVGALGACVWCMKRAHIDYSILSLASFNRYDPLDIHLSGQGSLESIGHTMVLDDVSLTNLDILAPGKQAGTLFEQLDTTVTAFGKRLLRQWLCSPLTNMSALQARQDAVEALLNNPLLMAEAKAVLRKLPDLERLLRKVHSQGCLGRANNHPDARAIFFEQTTYGKKKISDFISILDGLRTSLQLVKMFSQESDKLNSTLLHKLLSSGEKGHFPDLEEHLAFYESSFDRAKALKEGVIVPNKGVDPEYDSLEEAENAILKEFDQYLKDQQKRLHCKNVTYWGSGRNRFQLEVPIAALSGRKIQEYELSSQKKGFRRYKTPAINEMLVRLTAAEEDKNKALRDTMENLFHSFDQHFDLWERAVKSLATLDVLLSLATYSVAGAEQMCRPVFVEASESPVLRIRDGKHPCILHTYGGGDFIPNDVVMEGKSSCLVVTGPNMGGKSTLMRQTGLLVVLAHLGCFVPATECRLSPVDRVFTRMGASDRIMARESTFFVELRETCAILRHATRNSLVLVDELGRGTATYDGAAIACAVVEQLAQVIHCRSLFSTHYHFLVEQFVDNPCIQLGHMACVVEGQGEEETITFLYKLTEGACPMSYGFNVARLAGLPVSVVALARKKAAACESETKRVRVLRKLFQNGETATDLVKELN